MPVSRDETEMNVAIDVIDDGVFANQAMEARYESDEPYRVDRWRHSS